MNANKQPVNKSKSTPLEKSSGEITARPPGGKTKGGRQASTRGKATEPAYATGQQPLLTAGLTRREYFKDIVATIREPLLVLDKDLRVLAANRSFYKYFKVKTGETTGKLVYELGNRQWDIPALRELLETILPQKAVFNDYEVEHDFPSIGKRTLLLNARRIPAPPKEAQRILLAFDDVTRRRYLEQVLRDSEERFHRAFETAPDSMLLVDKSNGRVLNSNQAAQETLGYPRQTILKKMIWEIGILEDLRQFKQVFLELEEKGFVQLLDKTIKTKRGGKFAADINLMDRAAVIQCNIRDISARKHAEEEVRKSEEFHRAIANSTPDHILVQDRQLRYTFVVNPQLGLTEKVMLGKTDHDFLPGKEAEQLTRVKKQVMETGKPVYIETSLISKKGEREYFAGTYVPSFDKHGQVMGLIGYFRNITERMRVEEKVKSLALFPDENPNPILRVRQDGTLLYANLAAQARFPDFGYQIDKRVPAFLDTIVKESFVARAQKLVEIQKDGKTWTFSLVPIQGKDYMNVYCTDITERKQAEEKLRIAEEHFRTLVEQTNSITYIVERGREAGTSYVSPQIEQVLGFAPEEWINQPGLWESLLHPEDRERVLAENDRADQTGDPFKSEYRIHTKDGRVIWLSDECKDIRDEHGKFLYWQGNEKDITERKQAEEALRESEARYRNIFENSPVGIFHSTPQGRYLQMNPCLADMFGYDSNTEAITHITDIAKQVYVNPVDRQEFTHQLEEQGQISEFVNQNRRKDGSLIWTSTDARVVKDQDGNIQYYEGFMRDISEQKQNETLKQHYADELEKRVEARTRELHAAQEQLVRKEKLATLGQMAGSVGHELRNPLGVINTSIYYLKMVLPEASEKIKQHMDIIEKQVHVSDKIISDLLNFSREVSSDPKAVSIKELVQRTLIRFPPPRTVELRLDLPEDLPEVYADPQHMEQVLGNLVMNACQAMATSSATGVDKGGTLSISAVRHKKTVALAVKDSGTGITPENMGKLFEPLFTTKPRGIGLGLAVSQKLIEANGGRIEVESEVGVGSTFTLVLPVKPKNV